MSQKKRRSEDPGKGKKGSRRRAPATEPVAADPAAEAQAGPPKKLPAFGFAEDLLGKKGHDAEGTGGEDAVEISEDDPRRIYTFADGLDVGRRDEESEATPQRLTSWVTFSLAGEVFALPVEPIREVLRVTSITRVPHAPQPIRGVTNLRGRVIPVIDLRRRIDLPTTDLDRSSRVIVVASRGRLLGLLVDVVHQVLRVDLNQVQAPPEDVMTEQSDYILGVYHHGEQLILLFDVDRALVIQGPTPTVPPAAVGETAAGRSEEGTL